MPLRWVFVHDLTGTHRDEYFFTTDPAMTPRAVIEAYTGRWNIETTFQEMRAYLGLGDDAGLDGGTVLRAAPCLFGLYSVVALLYERLPSRGQASRRRVEWPGKVGGDVLRRHDGGKALAVGGVGFCEPWVGDAFSELPRALRDALLSALAPTA